MAARILPELRVAAVQFEPRPADKSFNLARIAAFVEQASAQGVQLVAFPEMCLVGYWHLRKLARDQLVGVAEPISGPSVAAVSALACRIGIGIGIGFLEVDERGMLYNGLRRVSSRRSDPLSPKAVRVRARVDLQRRHVHRLRHALVGSGGLLICWDNNLVENVRATALLGAEVIVAPHQTGGTASRSPHGMHPIPMSVWDARETIRKPSDPRSWAPAVAAGSCAGFRHGPMTTASSSSSAMGSAATTTKYAPATP